MPDPPPGGKPAGLEVKGTSERMDGSPSVCLAAERLQKPRVPAVGRDQKLPPLGNLRKERWALKPLFMPASPEVTKRPYRNFAQGPYERQTWGTMLPLERMGEGQS